MLFYTTSRIVSRTVVTNIVLTKLGVILYVDVYIQVFSLANVKEHAVLEAITVFPVNPVYFINSIIIHIYCS